MPRVKVTVVKKMNNSALYGDQQPADVNRKMLAPECHRFQVGQEFILDTNPQCPPSESWENVPPGFCPWAFADIQRDLVHVLFGGSFPWLNEKHVAISCCTDGLRPVVFRIERIAE